MRNIALQTVQTPYVFLADVDIIPKPGLDRELHDILKTKGAKIKKTV